LGGINERFERGGAGMSLLHMFLNRRKWRFPKQTTKRIYGHGETPYCVLFKW
jgi:hypothetical protein